ncbi:unnamed protein product, partial [Ectocarpus sp. 8 AP-2014]
HPPDLGNAGTLNHSRDIRSTPAAASRPPLFRGERRWWCGSVGCVCRSHLRFTVNATTTTASTATADSATAAAVPGVQLSGHVHHGQHRVLAGTSPPPHLVGVLLVRELAQQGPEVGLTGNAEGETAPCEFPSFQAPVAAGAFVPARRNQAYSLSVLLPVTIAIFRAQTSAAAGSKSGLAAVSFPTPVTQPGIPPQAGAAVVQDGLLAAVAVAFDHLPRCTRLIVAAAVARVEAQVAQATVYHRRVRRRASVSHVPPQRRGVPAIQERPCLFFCRSG